MKKQVIRYIFHEVAVVVADESAVAFRSAFQKYLGLDRITRHYEVTDTVSGEIIDVDFSKVYTIHTHLYTPEP